MSPHLHLDDDVPPVAAQDDATAAIIGDSPPIRRVRRLIGKLARAADSTVLITGQSGTGKDLAARALHGAGPRAAGPFIHVTCTALPPSLLESELFGHERGAFTDAKARHRGLFEQAAGGTLFLDEIGDMDPLLQAKLLRVLEEKRYRRVGGHGDLVANVRVIAATNVDLTAAVVARRFRQDLYYRLAVLVLPMPSLRERREDIAVLARHFVALCGARVGRRTLHVSTAALEALLAYGWPGNVRELRNVIERGVILCETDTIDVADLEIMQSPAPEEEGFTLPSDGVDMQQLERELLLQALERTRGNVTRAARLLGMSRDQVRYRIQKLSGPWSGSSGVRVGQAGLGGDAHERAKAAVGAGDHPLSPDQPDEARDPLGQALGVLDVVGRRIADTRQQNLVRGQS